MSIQPAESTLQLDALKAPLDVGAVQIKNRLVMASLTRSRAVPEDFANDHLLEYYRQRAAGGTGLILSEGTLGRPDSLRTLRFLS